MLARVCLPCFFFGACCCCCCRRCQDPVSFKLKASSHIPSHAHKAVSTTHGAQNGSLCTHERARARQIRVMASCHHLQQHHLAGENADNTAFGRSLQQRRMQQQEREGRPNNNSNAFSQSFPGRSACTASSRSGGRRAGRPGRAQWRQLPHPADDDIVLRLDNNHSSSNNNDSSETGRTGAACLVKSHGRRGRARVVLFWKHHRRRQ
jgi:hypothetical protein